MLNHVHYYSILILTKCDRIKFWYLTRQNERSNAFLTSSISQRKISLSKPLLSSNNIILRFAITARQSWLSLISLNVISKYLWRSETVMSKIIILDVLNVKINYFCHLDKLNIVNNYIWWVTNEKNNDFWHYVISNIFIFYVQTSRIHIFNVT